MDDKGVIHIPAPEPGGWSAVLRAFCSKYSIYRLATMGLTGEPMAAPMTVLSLRVESFTNRSFIIFRAGSMGSDVNRADTSYELRHSPGAKVMCLTCSTKSWVLFMWWGTCLLGV